MVSGKIDSICEKFWDQNVPAIRLHRLIIHGMSTDDLDDSPVTWHITEPVDPNQYQNEWLGSVINIY
jgi:hypothetical protein